jgi:hypothetical protein
MPCGSNPEDTILHSHRRENLKSYIVITEFRIMFNKEITGVKKGMNTCCP